MNKHKETIEEYDKRARGNLGVVFGVLVFIAFQLWICNLLGLTI